MTEPDIRKLNELLKSHRVLYQHLGEHFYVSFINGNINIRYNGYFKIANLAKMHADDFFVAVPLSQIKKGLQL